MDDGTSPRYVLGLADRLRHAIPRDAKYTRERVIPEHGRTWWQEIARAVCGADATRSLVPWESRDFCETPTDDDCAECALGVDAPARGKVSPAC